MLADVNITGQYSIADDHSWSVLALGVSAAIGPSIGGFLGGSVGGEAHLGTIKLISPATESSKMSIGQKIYNWYTHLPFLHIN